MHRIRYSTPGLWFKYINRTSSVIGMVAALIFASLFSIFVYFTVHHCLFILFSESAQATVLGKRQARLEVPFPFAASVPLYAHGKGGPRYLIQYEYADAAGNKHKGEDRTRFDAWNRTNPGDQVEIRYDSRKPDSSQLASTVWEFWPAIPFSLVGTAIISTFLYFGIGGLRWIGCQVRIIKYGDAVHGLITAVGDDGLGKTRNHAVCILTYEFVTAFRQCDSVRLAGRARSNWQVGKGIVVLIDPKDPTRHAPDIFDARREDRLSLFGMEE